MFAFCIFSVKRDKGDVLRICGSEIQRRLPNGIEFFIPFLMPYES